MCARSACGLQVLQIFRNLHQFNPQSPPHTLILYLGEQFYGFDIRLFSPDTLWLWRVQKIQGGFQSVVNDLSQLLVRLRARLIQFGPRVRYSSIPVLDA
jgi:hypothetical protein